MEPRLPTSSPNPGFPASVLDYYDHCYAFAMMYYQSEVERVRKLRFEDLTPDLFWSEYIWCVYASGFNAKILAKKFEAIMQAYGNWKDLSPSLGSEYSGSRKNVWARVKLVFANEAKFNAIYSTGLKLFRDWMHDLAAGWWLIWRDQNLATTQLIQKFPYMGPITCHHLARNIGLDTVKPDLHLTRLANHYQFDTPLRMCEYIAVNRSQKVLVQGKFGTHECYDHNHLERLGVVDLVLWYGASTWGTLDIKDAKLGDLR